MRPNAGLDEIEREFDGKRKEVGEAEETLKRKQEELRRTEERVLSCLDERLKERTSIGFKGTIALLSEVMAGDSNFKSLPKEDDKRKQFLQDIFQLLYLYLKVKNS